MAFRVAGTGQFNQSARQSFIRSMTQSQPNGSSNMDSGRNVDAASMVSNKSNSVNVANNGVSLKETLAAVLSQSGGQGSRSRMATEQLVGQDSKPDKLEAGNDAIKRSLQAAKTDGVATSLTENRGKIKEASGVLTKVLNLLENVQEVAWEAGNPGSTATDQRLKQIDTLVNSRIDEANKLMESANFKDGGKMFDAEQASLRVRTMGKGFDVKLADTVNVVDQIIQPASTTSSSKVWSQVIGANGTADEILGMTTDSAGNVYVVGRTQGQLGSTPNANPTGDIGGVIVEERRYDAFVRKYNSSGSEQWTTQIGSVGSDTVNAISIGPDGKLYVAGAYNMQGSGGGGQAIWQIDKNSGVTTITDITAGSGMLGASAISTVTEGSGTAVYVVGTERGTQGSLKNKATLTKYLVTTVNGTQSLTQQWKNYIASDGTAGTTGKGISIGNDGSIFVAGDFEGPVNGTDSLNGQNNIGQRDVYVMKYNQSGNQLWTKFIGSNSGEWFGDIKATASGDVFVAGTAGKNFSSGVNFGGGNQGFVTKLDGAGNSQWTDYVGGSGFDMVGKISIVGNYIFATGATGGGMGAAGYGGDWDSFVSKTAITASGLGGSDTLLFGGANWDQGQALSVDSSGNVFVGGVTNRDIPSTNRTGDPNGGQRLYGGAVARSGDAFIARYSFSGIATQQQQSVSTSQAIEKLDPLVFTTTAAAAESLQTLQSYIQKISLRIDRLDRADRLAQVQNNYANKLGSALGVEVASAEKETAVSYSVDVNHIYDFINSSNISLTSNRKNKSASNPNSSRLQPGTYTIESQNTQPNSVENWSGLSANPASRHYKITFKGDTNAVITGVKNVSNTAASGDMYDSIQNSRMTREVVGADTVYRVWFKGNTNVATGQYVGANSFVRSFTFDYRTLESPKESGATSPSGVAVVA